MVSTKTVIASVVVTLSVCIYTHRAQEMNGGQCDNLNMSLSEDELMNLEECTKELEISSWKSISQEQIACFGKCVIEKRGLIDKTGGLHVDLIFATLNSTLPETLRDNVMGRLDGCLMENAQNIDPNDGTCQSYMSLLACFHNSFMEACQDPMTEKPMMEAKPVE